MGLCSINESTHRIGQNQNNSNLLSSLLEKEDYEFFTRQFGKLLEDKNMKKAKNCLLKYILKAKSFNQKESRVLTGGTSTLELFILNELKKNGKIKFDYQENKEFFFHRAYHILAAIYYLKRNYRKAEEYANEAITWNFFAFDDMYLIINISDFIQNNQEKSEKIFFEEIYPLIHMPNDLAKFYLNLSKHYFYYKKYDLAYACYKQSMKLNTEKEIIIEAEKIKEQLEIKEFDSMTDEDIIKILEINKIPLNISDEMTKVLKTIYNNSSFILSSLIERIFISLNLESLQ